MGLSANEWFNPGSEARRCAGHAHEILLSFELVRWLKDRENTASCRSEVSFSKDQQPKTFREY